MINRASLAAVAAALTIGDYLMIAFFGLGLAAFLLLALNIQRQLAHLLRDSKDNLMNEKTLQDTMDQIKALVTAVAARMSGQADTIAMLQRQQTNGTPVSQEQLDALGAEAGEIKAMLSALSGSGDGSTTGQQAQPPAEVPPAVAEVPPAEVPPAASEPAAVATSDVATPAEPAADALANEAERV